MRITLTLICAVVALSVADANAQSRPPQEQSRSEQHGDISEQKSVSAPDSQVTDVGSQADQSQASVNAHDQQQDWGMLWLTLGLLIAAALQAWFAGVATKGLEYARLSADAAQKTLEGLERPYLFATIIGGADFGTNQGVADGVRTFGLWVDFKYGLINIGRSPAVVRSVAIATDVGRDPANALKAALADTHGTEVHWLIAPAPDPREPKPKMEQCRFQFSRTEQEFAAFDSSATKDILAVAVFEYEAVYGKRFRRVACWLLGGRKNDRAMIEYGGSKYNFDEPLPDRPSPSRGIWF